MKRGAWFRFGKQAGNESADESSHRMPSRVVIDETEMLYPGMTARAINPNYEANE